jgi:hypothetical protein
VKNTVLLLCCQILHGEHYLEVLRPIGTEGTLEVHCKMVDMLDKGSGTTVLVEGEMKAYTKLFMYLMMMPVPCIIPV